MASTSDPFSKFLRSERKIWFSAYPSGFGIEVTIAALARGDHVFATARDTSLPVNLHAKYSAP